MRETIKKYVEELFQAAPSTRRARELKDELLTNLTDRYDDLVEAGEDPQIAYAKVIDGIGDVEELIAMLEEQDFLNPVTQEKQRQKSALLVSGAVGIYILAIIPTFIRPGRAGTVVALIMVAAATMLLVYNGMSRPRYNKTDDSLVEDFKEWNQGKSQRKAAMAAIQSLIWTIAVIVYLLCGFLLHLWHIAWIAFLVAVAVNQVIRLVFISSEEKNP